MQRKTQVQEWSFCRHQPRQRTAAAIEMAIVQISQKINVKNQQKFYQLLLWPQCSLCKKVSLF